MVRVGFESRSVSLTPEPIISTLYVVYRSLCKDSYLNFSPCWRGLKALSQLKVIDSIFHVVKSHENLVPFSIVSKAIFSLLIAASSQVTLLPLVCTGFDCRCGNLFCGLHRYSDKHNCPYDYKAEAAAKIRKENPVVVAEKIQRI